MTGQKPHGVDLVHLDGTAIVHLWGEIDLAARTAVLEIAGPLLDAQPGKPLILDMAQVTFLDSSGLACLATLHNRATQANATVQVRNPSEAVRQVLRLTGMESLVEDRAVAARSDPPATTD